MAPAGERHVIVERRAAWQAKLVFLSEAYDDKEGFLRDVGRLTREVLSDDGAYAFLRPFLTVEAIWVPSSAEIKFKFRYSAT